jgi:hypothetical protein
VNVGNHREEGFSMQPKYSTNKMSASEAQEQSPAIYIYHMYSLVVP